MKAVLEFNLPEEQDYFDLAQRGGAYESILHDIQQFIRKQIKYGEISEERRTALSDVMDILKEVYDVNPNF